MIPHHRDLDLDIATRTFNRGQEARRRRARCHPNCWYHPMCLPAPGFDGLGGVGRRMHTAGRLSTSECLRSCKPSSGRIMQVEIPQYELLYVRLLHESKIKPKRSFWRTRTLVNPGRLQQRKLVKCRLRMVECGKLDRGSKHGHLTPG